MQTCRDCCSEAAIKMLGLPKEGPLPADHWVRWLTNKPTADLELRKCKGQEQNISISELGRNFLQKRGSANQGKPTSAFIERKELRDESDQESRLALLCGADAGNPLGLVDLANLGQHWAALIANKRQHIKSMAARGDASSKVGRRCRFLLEQPEENEKKLEKGLFCEDLILDEN